MLRRTALVSILVIAATLSCRETVPLPPVEGPPLSVPDGNERPPTFAADQPLQVIYATPEGQLDSPHLQITVSFSKPMIALTKVEDQAEKSPLQLSPPIKGKQRWLGTRTLVFEPEAPLAGSTEYQVEVPAGLKALDGSTLPEARKWTFTTPRLSVSRVYPHRSARWQRQDASVQLWFNQPIKATALEQHLKVVAHPTRKTIKDARPVPFKLTQGKNSRQVVIRPARSWPLDSAVLLSLAAGIVGDEGPLPTTKGWDSRFWTYGPLKVLSISCNKQCYPDDSIRVEFSNPVHYGKGRRAIRLNGKGLSRRDSSYTTRSIYADAKLAPRKAYKLTVKAGLRDKFGQKLAKTASFSFNTGDYRPFVYFPISNGVLEAGSALQLPVNFRNANKATLYSKRLSETEVAQLLGHEDWWSDETLLLDELKGATQQKIKVAGAPNKRLTRRVDLAPMLGTGKRGLLGLELTTRLRDGKETRRETQRAVIRVTDLAMTAKYSPHGLMIWVTSLSKGTPVNGANLSLWRKGGKKAMWRGKTDASGLAMLRDPDLLGDSEDRRLLFFAEKDGDRSYVSSGTQGGISPWDFGMEASWDNKDNSLIGVVFSDRGLYRPGEQVHLKGVVRRDGRTGLEKPKPGTGVKLVVNDARGEKLLEKRLELSEFGTLNHKVEITAGAHIFS